MAVQGKRRKDRLTPTQIRAARRTRRDRRRRFLRTLTFSAVGVVAFLLVASLFAGGLPLSFGGVGAAYQGHKVDLPSDYQPLVTEHLDPGESHPPYSSRPATSGWHYGAPANWGIHDEVIPDETLVQNLERAGVGIHYSCPEGCEDLVAKLAEIASEYHKVVMSPYPDMYTTIALTAWTYMDQLDEFDESRIVAFINAHVNSSEAPESQVP